MSPNIPNNYNDPKLIGKGGQGKVYTVKKGNNPTIYALKVIDTKSLLEEKREQRILSEIKSLENITHPNIVKVNSTEQKENTLYIEMEYIKGKTLEQTIHNNPLSYTEYSNIMLELLGGMMYLHDHNITHLDIKPSNIVLRSNNEPILTDFGSSLLLDKEKKLYTITGEFECTPGYAAPEIFLDEAKKFNPKSADIFSLGATLYTLFTQQTLYNATDRYTYAILLKNKEPIKEPYLVNNDIPEELSNICMKALAFEPEDRFESCREFYDHLNSVLINQKIMKPKNTFSSFFKKNKSLFNKLLIAGCAMSVVFGGYTVVSNYIHTKNEANKLYKLGNDCYETSDYERAKIYYEKAIKHKHAGAMSQLAILYQRGHGVIKNYKEAIKLWKQAKEKGHQSANENIAFLYQTEDKDYEKAIEYYKEAYLEDHKYYVAINIGEIYEDTRYKLKEPDRLERAKEWYEKAAKNGFGAEANFKLAKLELKSSGTPNYQKYKKAKEYYVKAFRAGNNEAYLEVANLYMKKGYGLGQNYNKALQYYSEAAEQGNIVAIKAAIYLNEHEKATTEDYEKKVLMWYKKAAENKYPEAMLALGTFYQNGTNGEKKDYTKALEYYKQVIASSDDHNIKNQARIKIANIYFRGDETEKFRNWEKALDYYEKIDWLSPYYSTKDLQQHLRIYHEGGYRAKINIIKTYEIAQKHLEKYNSNKSKKDHHEYLEKFIEVVREKYIMEVLKKGRNYKDGKNGEQKNYTKAIKWFLKAAKEEDTDAMYELGNIFTQLEHKNTQYFEVRRLWYKRAADNGHTQAMYELGNIYKNKYNENNKALKLYKKAGNKGNIDAMLQVANIYEYGVTGIEINKKESLKWYQKAADKGDKKSALKLARKYFKGDKVLEKNWEKAAEYYEKVNDVYSDFNIEDARNHLKIYSKKTNSSEYLKLLEQYVRQFRKVKKKHEKKILKTLKSILDDKKR